MLKVHFGLEYTMTLTRRGALKKLGHAIVGAGTAFPHTFAASQVGFPLSAAEDMPHAPIKRRNNIRQSVARWCYARYSLDELCNYSAKIGLHAIDLLRAQEFDVPPRHGLVCSMGRVDAGSVAFGFNRLEHHATLEQALRTGIPKAAHSNVPNVITFSGLREGLSDAKGLSNTIVGLNRVKKIAEDHGVTICLELLNSKVNHPDYMGDHFDWGLRVMQEVNSSHIKILYDIYHMQLMDGDLIRTITQNLRWIGHFHTGGVPGRGDIDGTQEVNYAGVMRAIAHASYSGYVAHEFFPEAADPLHSLRRAADICDI